MIEETVPLDLLGIFGPFTNLFNAGGKMLSIIIGVGMPNTTDKHGLATTNFWKVIFGVPFILIALQMVAFLLYFRRDTVKYSLLNSKDKDAEIEIKKIYGSSEDHTVIQNELRSQCVVAHTKSIGMRQALLNRKFRKATWYCFALVVFN